ncbi:MAG: hypothetical protein U9N85_04850 [Bacteroidota bacterium]|nr:hypothetical protein [Bacteroidota bacterium]
MKKTIFVMSFLAIIASVALINSCNKTEINEPAQEFADGTELAKQILDFKANMTSKSGENMSLADALKNMELLINAEHGFPFEEYAARKHEVVSFLLQADENGEVSQAQINTAYTEMKNEVREAYTNSGFDQNGLILVTLSINKEDKNETTVNANVTTGEIHYPGSNNFTDCWYYGDDMGQCSGTQYEGIMDGGDTIANTIAANNPIFGYYDCPGPPSEWRLILDPQPLIILQGNEYQNAQGDYLMFFYPDPDGDGLFTDEEKQLSAEDMNYYYDNEYNLIYNILPEELNYPFPDYVLVNCEIDGNQLWYNNDFEDLTALRHKNELTYAHRYWVHKDIIPDPIEL